MKKKLSLRLIAALIFIMLPVTVLAAGSIVGWGNRVYVSENDLADLVAVDAGPGHSLGLRPDGSIVAWGDNSSGACDVPVPNADFIAIATGGTMLSVSLYEDRLRHSLGVKSDGSIVAWGSNTTVPTENFDFIAVSAGSAHFLGLRSDGSVVAWGVNQHGQCDVPEPNTDFVAIAAGPSYSLGLKSDGEIIAWGTDPFGAHNVPGPNGDFIAIACSKCCVSGPQQTCHGWAHSLGLKSDGSIVAWVRGDYGQCSVPEPNSDFIAISAAT
jgi:alpha-tubulin suppressor-like RCC1 family protein